MRKEGVTLLNPGSNWLWQAYLGILWIQFVLRHRLAKCPKWIIRHSSHFIDFRAGSNLPGKVCNFDRGKLQPGISCKSNFKTMPKSSQGFKVFLQFFCQNKTGNWQGSATIKSFRMLVIFSLPEIAPWTRRRVCTWPCFLPTAGRWILWSADIGLDSSWLPPIQHAVIHSDGPRLLIHKMFAIIDIDVIHTCHQRWTSDWGVNEQVLASPSTAKFAS